MANEASEGLNGLIERMQSADQAIEQSRGALQARMDGFAALFDPGAWDDPFEQPDIDQEGEAVEAAAAEAAQALQDRLGGTLSALGETFDTNILRLSETSTAWSGASASADDDVKALQVAFEDAAQRTMEALKELGAAYESAKEALSTAQTATDDALTTAEAALSGEMASAFESQVYNFLTDLADAQTARVREGVENAQQQAEQVLNRLSEICTRLLTDFEQQLANALEQLADRVGNQFRSEVEDAAREIVEEAVRELSYAIMEAIAASQVGVAVTGAMAPVLPQLIAAKRLTDVILEAIRLWKDTVGRLGSFF